MNSPLMSQPDGGMKIELLHIADCPNWEETLRLLRAALDATGHQDVRIGVEVLDSVDAAARRRFAGSRTILVEGFDPFPSAGGTRSLACRVHPTPRGNAGHPTQDQLEEAIITHA
jgi:hypothetical protein